MPKFFIPRPDKMADTRRLHAQGNVRFMKSAFVKETLGEKRLWSEEDRPIMVRDGNSITVRVYRPTNHPDSRPVMVYAHSGGYCMGGLDTEEFICQTLCMKLGIIIVSVAYRLGPEWLYPTSVLDTYDTIKWVCRPPDLCSGTHLHRFPRMLHPSAATCRKDS
jgi:acetyl esterase/lipase